MSMNAQVLADTREMTREDWLLARTQGIGGSDASIVLGLNKYKTAFELWLEKTGQSTLEETDSEAAYWGTRMEDVVAEEFATRTGKKVRRRNVIFRHQEYPWMIANIDRMVVGENAILECKTASEWLRNEWKGDEIPDAYIIQPQHYMAVTGADKAYIAVLIGGNKFMHKEIARDEELIQMIIAAEKHFWEFHVLGNNPPALDGSSAAEKYLKERFERGQSGKSIHLAPTYQERIEQMLSLKQQVSALEAQQKAIENQIKAEMEDAEMAEAGAYRINWKTITSYRFDAKAFQAAHPDLFDAYSKPSVSRRFEVKEAK